MPHNRDAVSVGEHALALVVRGEVVEHAKRRLLVLRDVDQRDEFGQEAGPQHVVPQRCVEGQVEQQPQCHVCECGVRVWHQARHLTVKEAYLLQHH